MGANGEGKRVSEAVGTNGTGPVLEPLLKVEQVAEALGFKPSTIRAYCETGKMPHVRIGGHLRFRRVDVLEWIEQHARKPLSRSRSRRPVKAVAPVPDSAIS